MTADGPSVSLIIVNHRSAGLTADLVAGAAGEVDEMVIVDNPADGPTEVPELEAVAAGHDHVRVVPLPRNIGFGAGANAGAAVAHGDVLVISNPDVQIDPGALRTLAAAAHGRGVTGPRFRNVDGTLQRSAHHRDPGLLVTMYDLCPPVSGILARVRPGWHPTHFSVEAHATLQPSRHLLGALLAIDAEAFRSIGGFDEDFFLYREETDLCHRLLTAGRVVEYRPEAGAVHIGGASTASGWPQAARPIMLESHYRYIAKHRGRVVAGLARALGTVGALIWLVRMRDARAARRSLRWHLTGRVGDPV